MKIYRIKEDYVEYLRTKEPKVLKNKEEKRPYIGIVLQLTDYKYFVPLSSPKPKHKDMKNIKDFHKIAGGKYGVINFNKIIPVPTECIIDFKFEDEEDVEYRTLLQNQYNCIKDMKTTIIEKSNSVYKLFHTPDLELTTSDLRVKQRCCDFDLLEKMCNDYKKKDAD